MEEPLIETLVDHLTEPTIELVSSLIVVSLRSPDVYDPLQIFLQETVSQEIGILVCELVFSGTELHCYVARIWFELPSTSVRLSQQPVAPPPPCFSHDVSVLIP